MNNQTNRIASPGKFKIFLKTEDLDPITPTPSVSKELCEKDTEQEAVIYAETLYRPGFKYPSVYNDKGERVYPK